MFAKDHTLAKVDSELWGAIQKENTRRNYAGYIGQVHSVLVEEASKLDGFDGSDTDVLTYAMFPSVAPGFLANRDEGPKNAGKTPEQLQAEASSSSDAGRAVQGPITYKVSLGGRENTVTVERA